MGRYDEDGTYGADAALDEAYFNITWLKVFQRAGQELNTRVAPIELVQPGKAQAQTQHRHGDGEQHSSFGAVAAINLSLVTLCMMAAIYQQFCLKSDREDSYNEYEGPDEKQRVWTPPEPIGL